ncbi:MAG TPA: homoserine dehydrogenase [Acidimicrobiales bacterium]|jgi:homoserine dehydrogenase|nr:homoserine dehydrogenase [Acidimicrobiales bacterium]
MTPEPVRVGLLGCGNVGAALVELIRTRSDDIAARTGLALEVARVAVRSTTKERSVTLPEGVLTHDAAGVVTDPDIDVVVEVIGGIEPARELTLDAIKAGKPVITANKELLANVGAELFAAADHAGVDLLFEAAVGGGIPVIRPLRESLAGERIDRVMGIVNGTTNYILTRMTEAHASYADALSEAQSLGYAERDPTADVEGYDAAAKAAIIASIAFGVRVVAGDVTNEGIAHITRADIDYAAKMGYVIKLLAIAEQRDGPGGGEVGVRVHPAMVPAEHPLASVRDSFNAVFVEGAAVGDLMFYGRGAGGFPTATAVLGDLIDAAVNRARGSHASIGVLGKARIRPIDEVETAYYLNIDVFDRPGVLAAVAGVFGAHGVSIRSMEQEGLGDEARLVFITHVAREAAMQATVRDLHHLEAVDRITSVLRVIGE